MTDPSTVCADCAVGLPDPSPTSPAVRRCQSCWWAHQRALPDAERHPLASAYLAHP